MKNKLPHPKGKRPISSLTHGIWYFDHDSGDVFTLGNTVSKYNDKEVLPVTVVTHNTVYADLFRKESLVSVVEVPAPVSINWS